MKTKKSLLFIILALLPGFVLAQGYTDKTSGFHVSFFPPLSTHGPQAKEYTNYVSFNILAGISKNEKILTFGGLANIIVNDAGGLQFAGLTNLVGEKGAGVQFGGLFNMAGAGYNGLQFGGLGNITKTFTGVQFGGIGNLAEHGSGLQFGGVFNVSQEMKGIQFAGIANVSENVTGFQFGGVGNIANDVTGFQFGGIFNKARNVKGAQFGTILNIAENSDYPIGLINIIKNGEMGIGVSYNELGSINTTFRSGGRVLYGILGAAFNPDIHDKFGFEGGFGAHINIVSRFRINLELKHTGFDMFSDNHFMHSSFSIIPAFRILPNLEIFAGGSYNYLQTDNLDNRKAFPGHNTWRKFTDSKLKQLNFGYTVGTQFVF